MARRFDRDEARRLREAGLSSYPQIGRALGVSGRRKSNRSQPRCKIRRLLRLNVISQ